MVKFKFNLEQIVMHKTVFGELFVIARGYFESKNMDGVMVKEIVYKCRMADGSRREFLENELLPLTEIYKNRILKAKCVDLEHAKKLVEAGVKIETEKFHVHNKAKDIYEISKIPTLDSIPAPDSDELLEWLPDYIETQETKYWFEIFKEKNLYTTWYIDREENKVVISFDNTNLPNALAELACWVEESR